MPGLLDYGALAKMLMGGGLLQPAADQFPPGKKGLFGDLGGPTEGARAYQGGANPAPALPKFALGPGEFAKRAQSVANQLPDTAMVSGSSFQNKVSLAELHNAYKEAYPRDNIGNIETFKHRLVESAKRQELELSRLDMPQHLAEDLRVNSRAPWNSDEVHFIMKK